MRSRESISVREGPCNSALPDLQTDLWHVRLNGIAYNHEAPRRGENFVTRKITMAAARIKAGAQLGLEVGDLGSRRDWGYAREYGVATSDATQDFLSEMMLPVARFESTGNTRLVVWGLLGERGGFVTLGRESSPADEYPALHPTDDKACWIHTEKLPALRELVPKNAMHFSFGPRSIQWRSEQCMQVHPSRSRQNGHFRFYRGHPRL